MKTFFMDWQQFKLRFWLCEPVYCEELEEEYVFYMIKPSVCVQSSFKKSDVPEQNLLFTHAFLRNKPDLYFVRSELELEDDPVDVFYEGVEESEGELF